MAGSLLLVGVVPGPADAYGGPTTIPGSTSACRAEMASSARYGAGVFNTIATTRNLTGCNEVNARVKFDSNSFGPWRNGGSGTATVSSTLRAIGGSHKRCNACTTYAT